MEKSTKRRTSEGVNCNLIINFKRFTHQYMGFSKSSKTVKFPLILKMDKYTMQEVPKDDKDLYEKYFNAKISEEWNHNHTYELYGIVSHSGSMRGGHYIAYVCYKHNKKRVWLYCSDSRVCSIDESEALESEAYILFYRKIEHSE